MTSQRLGKYACLELERRYLLRQLPHDLQDRENGWLIEDRYVAGTRLRLRRMSALGGGEVLYKFGQKYRAPFQSAAETTMTNMYLDEGEYDRLRQLEANTLVKKRLRYDHEGRPYGIDVFEGRLEGLILAETECETIEEYERLPLPPFAHIDVTAEPFYTGGHLATLSRKAFQETLARWL